MKKKGAGIIFICGEEILLLQKFKGIWEIPGGRKEKNEKYLNTARRETREECSICPEFKMIGNYIFENLKNKYVIYFAKVEEKFSCNLSNEHVNFKWFNIKNLPKNIHAKITDAVTFLAHNWTSIKILN